MFCPKCGVQNGEAALICSSCGAELPRLEPIPAPAPGIGYPPPGQPVPEGQAMGPGQMMAPYGAPPPPAASQDFISSLVPYKNGMALAAYYLGVFSLIPGIGLFLGIAAFFLGLKGLKYQKLHPEAHGKGHALVGVIVGGLTGWGTLVLILALIIASLR